MRGLRFSSSCSGSPSAGKDVQIPTGRPGDPRLPERCPESGSNASHLHCLQVLFHRVSIALEAKIDCQANRSDELKSQQSCVSIDLPSKLFELSLQQSGQLSASEWYLMGRQEPEQLPMKKLRPWKALEMKLQKGRARVGQLVWTEKLEIEEPALEQHEKKLLGTNGQSDS